MKSRRHIVIGEDQIKKIVEEDPYSASFRIDDYGSYVTDQEPGYLFERATGRLYDISGEAVYKAKYAHQVEGHAFEYFKPNTQPSKNYGKPVKAELDQMLYEWKDAEAINDGVTIVVSVRAEAHFLVNGIAQTITSGVIGGVDVKDFDDPYLDEVFEEQKAELVDILDQIGIEVV